MSTTSGRPEVRAISGGHLHVDATVLTWSESLRKRVRTGDWVEQATSTTRRVHEAIDSGQWEVTAELVDYWMEEANVCFVIYDVWLEGFDAWLETKGVARAEIERELERLNVLLAFPDGVPYDRVGRWTKLGGRAGEFGALLRSYQLGPEDAHAAMDELLEHWRQLHDRTADLIGGLLTYVAGRFGEAAIGDCYRFVLEPYLQERYGPFDVREQQYDDTIERNLYLSLEAMRGHLVGPDRWGEVELEEREDSWVLRFDPCGSGGRMARGDLIEGTPSRSEPPYGFGVTQEQHDWAWNEKGVCYYCAHCCFALERWPAEQWGHPIRVVDSPLYPEETSGDQPKKCTWTIYKSLDAIPDSAYERIGLKKPDDSSAEERGE
jgi:hypothetical protein